MSSRSNNVFDDVVYAQCWEDPELDREAYRRSPAGPMFSVTSGGCNVLAFLLDDPTAVYAVDFNPHQNYLLELKMAAWEQLRYEDLLGFLGVNPSSTRREIYYELRPSLPVACRGYWDSRHPAIDGGILHCGSYEHYMGLLRRWLGIMIGTSTIHAMLETRDQEERTYLYDHRWNTVLWRIFTRLFLSRRVMGHLFTDEFFAYVGSTFSFGTHFREMTRRALTGPLGIDNPYLSYILLGRFPNERAYPLYLRREHWEQIRSRINRVRTITGRCEEVLARMPADSIASFNFTNIFEWMPPEIHEHVMRCAWRAGKPGAILTYRNLLVERHRPPKLASRFDRHPALSARLHEKDRSFIYRAYVVESVKKGGLP